MLRGKLAPCINKVILPNERTNTKLSVKPFFSDNIAIDGVIHRVFQIRGISPVFTIKYTVKCESLTNAEASSLLAIDGTEVSFYPHSDNTSYYTGYLSVIEYNKNHKNRIKSLRLIFMTTDILKISDYPLKINTGFGDRQNESLSIKINTSLTKAITVIRPEGEDFFVDYNNRIQWVSNFSTSSSLNISLYKNDASYGHIASVINNNEYVWSPDSSLVGTNYKIHIEKEDDSTVRDISNIPFKIKEFPVLLLVVPNGGDSYDVNNTMLITWTSENMENTDSITIRLFKGGLFYRTLVGSTPNSGSYSASVVGAADGNDYTVVISYAGLAEDESDTTFTIEEKVQSSNSLLKINTGFTNIQAVNSPLKINTGFANTQSSSSLLKINTELSSTFTVTHPNGSEVISIGSSVDITWNNF